MRILLVGAYSPSCWQGPRLERSGAFARGGAAPPVGRRAAEPAGELVGAVLCHSAVLAARTGLQSLVFVQAADDEGLAVLLQHAHLADPRPTCPASGCCRRATPAPHPVGERRAESAT